MEWIYFSPHLDDVALSVGGLLWEQSRTGREISIWTICAGGPPAGEVSPFAQSLHDRWESGRDAIDRRRKEDLMSCRVLGSKVYHFNVPDCIYRRSPETGDHLYASEEDLWGKVHPDEKPLIDQLGQKIRNMLPKQTNLVCPLALGDHVDHHLTRQAVEMAILSGHKGKCWNLFYYADYPYVLETPLSIQNTALKSKIHTISTQGIIAWQESIACHQSQISTFWSNLEEMRSAIQSYYDKMGGIWMGYQ